MSFTPLDGVRVVDLSRHLPGPYLTRVLADLGADVVKVEPPHGDPARWMPPHVHGIGAAFSAFNAGKRFVCIDNRKPEGVALIRAMLGDADILVESWRPGILARMGLDPAELRKTHPRLIIASLTGYGQTGPKRNAAGHDVNYVARAGVLGQFGPAGRTSPTPGVQIADVGGGALLAATGVLAALIDRGKTGQGRHLDISLERGALAFATYALATTAAGLQEPRGGGSLTGGIPCYRVYPCKDGQLAVGALEPKFWVALCTHLGRPDLADKGFAMGAERDRVIAEVEAIFATRTRDAWVAHFEGVDACLEPVRSTAEVLADPALAVSLPRVGDALVVQADVGAPGELRAPTPPRTIGADNDDVFAGLPADLVAAAAEAGALGG
jgi:crotonobetainyl-CoA:carnitine CoA-transferase CaiB-like acyl-CoA transferase